MPSNSSRFNAPIIIDAQLPPEWTARLGFTGKARMTVIVAADAVRPGVEQAGDGFDLNAYSNGRGPRGAKRSGIVRTAGKVHDQIRDKRSAGRRSGGG